MWNHSVPTARAIFGVKTEHSELKPYRNRGESVTHTDLLCELVTSVLMKGIQMGGIWRLGWLIGLVKHSCISYTMAVNNRKDVRFT